jgi:hypothetical protein
VPAVGGVEQESNDKVSTACRFSKVYHHKKFINPKTLCENFRRYEFAVEAPE